MTNRTTMRNSIRLILLFLCAAVSLSIAAEAQVAGTISGYIRDESDAVIPGADV